MPLATALAFLFASTAASSPTLAQRVPRAAHARRSCVHYAQQASEDGRSITVSLENRCETSVEGTLSWSVACGAAGSESPEEHQATIASGQRQVLVASGATCGATDVRIDHVRWSWRPVSREF
jgi:hypothetical protein